MDRKWTIRSLALLWLCMIPRPAAADEWAESFRGHDNYSPRFVEPTADGGVVVGGSATFAGRLRDAWIMKLDASGHPAWEQSLGGLGEDHVLSLRLEEGGYVAAGATGSFGGGGLDGWILQLDSQGIPLGSGWQKTYGGSKPDYFESIQQTKDGDGYIVAGVTDSFGAGSRDAWVLRVASDGEVKWQKTLGGPDYDYASSIVQTLDEGYVFAGATTLASTDWDAWVVKVRADGSVAWQTAVNSGETDSLSVVRQTTDGGYVVAGSSGGPYFRKALVFRLDADGNMKGSMWPKTYGGAGDHSNHAYAVEETTDGDFIVAGSYNSAGKWFAWLLRLSPEGDIRWQRDYAMGGFDAAGHQTLDGYVLALVGPAAREMGVLKFDANGRIDRCEEVRDAPFTANSISATVSHAPPVVTDTTVTPQPTAAAVVAGNSVATTICSHLDPDLAVSLQPGPSLGCGGEALTVSDIVSNVRPGMPPTYVSDPTVLRFYLSADTLLSAGDRSVGERPTPFLPPEGSNPGSTTLTLPADASGLHYIIAAIDPDNAVRESDELNNFATKPIIIGPDLVVSDLARGEGTTTFAIRGSTKSQGACKAGATITRLYWSEDDVLDANDPAFGTFPVPSLAAPETSDFDYRGFRIPQALPEGTYYVFGKADADETVAEIRETNNTRRLAIVIRPDLSVSSVFPRVIPTAAHYYEVAIEVENGGSRDAGPFVVSFYQNLAAAPRPGQAGDFSCAPTGLAVGAKAHCSGTILYRDDQGPMPGPFSAWVQVDSGGQVNESDETNNVKSVSLY